MRRMTILACVAEAIATAGATCPARRRFQPRFGPHRTGFATQGGSCKPGLAGESTKRSEPETRSPVDVLVHLCTIEPDHAQSVRSAPSFQYTLFLDAPFDFAWSIVGGLDDVQSPQSRRHQQTRSALSSHGIAVLPTLKSKRRLGTMYGRWAAASLGSLSRDYGGAVASAINPLPCVGLG